MLERDPYTTECLLACHVGAFMVPLVSRRADGQMVAVRVLLPCVAA